MKRRIANLRRFGKNGWEWEEFNSDSERWVGFRTNGNGNGKWGYKPIGEYKQILGTSQFELPKKKTSAYSKLYRDHVKKYEWM